MTQSRQVSRQEIFNKKSLARQVERFGEIQRRIRLKNPQMSPTDLEQRMTSLIQNEINVYQQVVNEWDKAGHIQAFLYDKSLSEAGRDGRTINRDAAASLLRQLDDLSVLSKTGAGPIMSVLSKSAGRLNPNTANSKINTNGAKINA